MRGFVSGCGWSARLGSQAEACLHRHGAVLRWVIVVAFQYRQQAGRGWWRGLAAGVGCADNAMLGEMAWQLGRHLLTIAAGRDAANFQCQRIGDQLGYRLPNRRRAGIEQDRHEDEQAGQASMLEENTHAAIITVAG